jgi:hypothetical protein
MGAINPVPGSLFRVQQLPPPLLRPPAPPQPRPTSGPLTGHPSTRVAAPTHTPAPTPIQSPAGPLTGHPTTRVASPAAAPSTTAQPSAAAKAPATAQGPSTTDVVLDGTQLALDITGIVDPTPASDGANAVISLFRGDFKGAAISAASMLPAGDVLKASRIGERFTHLIAKAADNPAARKMLQPTLEKVGSLLEKVPIDKLPAPVREMVQSLKTKVSDYLHGPSPAVVSGPRPPGRAAASGAADEPNMRTAMTPRPGWKITEDQATRLPGATDQQSFLNGTPVRGNPRGSTRPDKYVPGFSIEAKNYDIRTPGGRNKLVNAITEQAARREANLPAGDVQKVTIDLRGQGVTPREMQALKRQIETESQQQILARHVKFLW